MAGRTKQYILDFQTERARRDSGWTPLEAAMVATMIDWRVSCDMRPSSGEGSDCSDLMNVALARLTGLMAGDLTPDEVMRDVDA